MFARPETSEPAALLAYLCGAPRAALLLEGGGKIVTYGDMPPIRGDRLYRDARAALGDAGCLTLRAGSVEARSASGYIWEARAVGLVVARAGGGPGAPIAIVPVEKEQDPEALLLRARAAAAIVTTMILRGGEGAGSASDSLQRFFVTLDPQGKICFAAPGLAAIVGNTSDALAGQSFARAVDPRSRPRFLRLLGSLERAGAASAILSLGSESSGSQPHRVAFTYHRAGEAAGILCDCQALAPDAAAEEIIGKLATSIFPEPGTTIRADRVVREAADLLDLRLLAIARRVEGGGPVDIQFDLAAGPSVYQLDEIARALGVAAWAARLAAPEQSEWTAGGDPDAELFNKFNVAAITIFPLQSQNGEILGSLVSLADTARALERHERRALQTVAEFLATDLERRRAREADERRAEELQVLFDAARELADRPDAETLLSKIVERAARLFGEGDVSVVYIFDGRSLRPRKVYGPRLDVAAAERVVVPLGGTLLGKAFTEQRSICVKEHEIASQLMLLPSESMQAYRDAIGDLPAPRGVLFVPLRAGERTAGVISVARLASEKQFSHGDLELLERFAAIATAAIVQSELFEAVRMRSELVDAVRDAVLSIGKNLQILYANEGAAALFGRADLRGAAADFQSLVDEGDLEILMAGMATAERTGHWIGYLRGKRGGGEAFDASVSVSVAQGAGGFVVIISDVTERRAIEARVMQSSTLDSLGKLAAGIAHDFNNLLGSILGFTSLMRGRVGASSALLNDIAGIELVAEQAARLARRLVILGKAAPGTRDPLDLNLVVENLCEVLRHSFDRRIEIVMQCAGDPCIVEGDETALRQAILNLAFNARDALPSGGRIIMKTRRLDGGFDQPGSIELSIADNGIGMDRAVLRRLYEPFFTTKPPGHGTGLGSAIVFATVRAHRGTIDCNSKPGAGTTFTLTFPRSLAEPEAKLTNVGDAAPPQGSGTVLIVEDEPMLRRVATELVGSLGYDTIAVPGGLEAIEVVRSRGSRVDLVLLDLTMPGMSGAEVFRSLRAIDPALRIVITTGFASAGAAETLLSEGALGLLAKPYRIADLALALSAARDAPARARQREIV